MYPTLFELKVGDFLLIISSYRFFGVLAAIYFLFFLQKILYENELRKRARVFIAVMIALSFLIGARLLFIIIFFEQVLDDPELIYTLKLTNFSLYGGMGLSVLSWYLITKQYQLPFLKLTDRLIPHGALALMFFRVGCFLNGCCFGKTTELPLGVTFPRGSLSHKVQLTPNPFSFFTSPKAVHPTQLYEILGVLLALIIAWNIWKKNKISGQLSALFIIFYSVARIANHFFRYYPNTIVWPQTMQAPVMYSLIILLCTAFVLVQTKNS